MRSTVRFGYWALLSLAGALAAGAGRANDTSAEIALGGLTFAKSDAISMDSEDLFISRDLVRVKYRFTNTTDAPVETLVAFPLPDIPPANEEDVRYWSDPAADLKFRTTVDGQPLALQKVEQAMFKGQDIGARLAALRIPLNRFDEGFHSAINRLPKPDRDKLVAEGLIREDGMSAEPLWAAMWTLRTALTRRQSFPAKKTIVVEHEYAPIRGGSLAGNLSPRMRGGENAQYFEATRRRFCVDDAFLRSFDRKFKDLKKGKDDDPQYYETWLGYVLKTGANWKGPIADFRLVVDKGRADSLVSFCAEGVKKISPTKFEWRRADFTPTGDLQVLIVDWTPQ